MQADQVFVANGADQILDCCFRAFCEPGDTVTYPWPTYSLFPVLAQLFSLRTDELSLTEGFALPSVLGTADAKLRVVVNPNSPTGVWMQPTQLEKLLAPATGVIVIDEAYCDFAPESCIPRLSSHENWLVVRTFSKSYSLAGLRVGYAVGSPELISDLYVVKDSYPLSRWSIAGAVAALEDQDHHRLIVETVRTERARLAAALASIGWDVAPTEANYVFARPPDGDALAVYERLRLSKILTRHWPTSDYADRLRITVGKDAEVDRLLDALGIQQH